MFRYYLTIIGVATAIVAALNALFVPEPYAPWLLAVLTVVFVLAAFALDAVIAFLESERQIFVADKTNKQAWLNMIQMLPTSFNQMRTVSMNYENLINIYYARRYHKLAEWHVLCDWILSLPYAAALIAIKEEQ